MSTLSQRMKAEERKFFPPLEWFEHISPYFPPLFLLKKSFKFWSKKQVFGTTSILVGFMWSFANSHNQQKTAFKFHLLFLTLCFVLFGFFCLLTLLWCCSSNPHSFYLSPPCPSTNCVAAYIHSPELTSTFPQIC